MYLVSYPYFRIYRNTHSRVLQTKNFDISEVFRVTFQEDRELDYDSESHIVTFNRYSIEFVTIPNVFSLSNVSTEPVITDKFFDQSEYSMLN